MTPLEEGETDTEPTTNVWPISGKEPLGHHLSLNFMSSTIMDDMILISLIKWPANHLYTMQLSTQDELKLAPSKGNKGSLYSVWLSIATGSKWSLSIDACRRSVLPAAGCTVL